MSEKLLEISGLSVCYEGEQILNNICFSVEKGETVGIAPGSQAVEKKYLAARAILRLMERMVPSPAGRSHFAERSWRRHVEKKLRSLCGSEIGMIFQNTGASLCPTRKKSESRSVKACAPMRNAADSITPISGGECLGRKAAEKSKI